MFHKLVIHIVAILAFCNAHAQTADFSAQLTTICVGQSVQFTNLSTGATTYSWTFPDGAAGQTSTLANPLISYNLPGTYTVALLVSNGTSNDTEIKPAFITVLSASTATLSSAPGTDNQFVCQGSLITQIAYDVTGATGADFSGLPAFATGAFNPSVTGGTMTVSGLASTPGTYPYSITTTGPGCTPITVNGVIVINASTSLTVTSAPGTANPTLCVNTTMIDIVFTVGGSPTSVSAIGLPTGVTGVLSGTTFTISGTPISTGSFNYSVVASGGGCPAVQYSGGIAVDPDVQLVSAPSTNNQTLCVNSPLGNIVYTLGPSITGATVTGLPPGITGTYNPGQFLISNSPSAAGTYNYTVTTSGGSCGPALVSGTITVNPPPTLSLDVPGTQIQTLCEGTPIANITYSVGGSATGANVTGLPAGISGIFNAGVFTLSGASTVGGTHNFTVSTTGSPCGTLNLTGTIVIHNFPELNLVSPLGTDNQEVCVNTAMDLILYQLSGTANNISVIDLPPGVNSNVQNDSVFIFGVPSTIGSFTYTVYTSGGTRPPDTVFGVITTGIPPVLNLTSLPGSNNQTVCLNDPINTIVYTISGAANSAFVNGLPLGVSAVFAGNTLTINGSPTVEGSYTFTVEGAGGFCPNATLSGQITVHNPQLTLVSPLGSHTQSLCINSLLDTIAYALSGGATGVNVINLPPGVTSLVQNDTVYIFGTVTSTGIYPFELYTTGTVCEADTTYGSITIGDYPTATLLSITGSDEQAVFENQAIETIIYLLNGGTNNVDISGLPPGVTTQFSGDSLIISGSPTTVGLWPYSFITTGGLCPGDTVFGVINVLIEIETLSVDVPNVFSPNNDASNDVWFVQTEYVEKIELTIVNRYGNIMLESTGPIAAWDGKTKVGSEANDGVYFYKMTVLGKDGSTTQLQGFFHLIR